MSRQVEVELRDLEKLGQLLERSIDLGVNQVGDPRLDSSKRQDLEREALAKAVADARLNAEAVAKAAGARLGAAAHDLRDIGLRAAADADGECHGDGSQGGRGSASYQSGQMGFNGTVQVEYDLIPGNCSATMSIGRIARAGTLAALRWRRCVRRTRSKLPKPQPHAASRQPQPQRRRRSSVTPTDERASTRTSSA